MCIRDRETPWHQDLPYYCVDGNNTGSFWIPLDEVNKENNLKLILGSHKWEKLLRPIKWSDAVSYTHLRAHETRGNLVCRITVLMEMTQEVFGYH